LVKHWALHLALGLAALVLAALIRLDVLPQAAAVGSPIALVAFALPALARAKLPGHPLWRYADALGAVGALAWLVLLGEYPELADLIPQHTAYAYLASAWALYSTAPDPLGPVPTEDDRELIEPFNERDTAPIDVDTRAVVQLPPKVAGPTNEADSGAGLGLPAVTRRIVPRVDEDAAVFGSDTPEDAA
jgi:hypothetical protein